MRALGAELIEHGRDFDEAREHCESTPPRAGLRYVHSANEPDLIAGVGTYGLEIFDDCRPPDVIWCRWAWAAASAARRWWRPGASARHAAVIGVQSELAPAVTLSWRGPGG